MSQEVAPATESGLTEQSFIIPDSVLDWPDEENFHIFADGRAVLFPNQQLLRVDGNMRPLDATCTKLAHLLVGKLDEVVRYQQIRDSIWGSWYISNEQSNSLPVALCALRRHLGGELSHNKTGAIITKKYVGLKAVSRLLKAI